MCRLIFRSQKSAPIQAHILQSALIGLIDYDNLYESNLDIYTHFKFAWHEEMGSIVVFPFFTLAVAVHHSTLLFNKSQTEIIRKFLQMKTELYLFRGLGTINAVTLK